MRSTTGPNGTGLALILAADRNGVQPLDPAPADNGTAKERLRAWLRARQTRRELAARNAADLLDQFGPAAPRIAQNCARQAVGLEDRKLWALVVRDIASAARYDVGVRAAI
jgi:hypothetical protein